MRTETLVLLAATIVACSPPIDPQLQEAIRWYTGVAGHVDEERAHALLLEAAADDDPISKMWLARCYSTGRMGFDHDIDRARELAAEVIDEISRLADAGVAEALFLMGTAHAEALGVDEDAAVAVEWYRRAADRSHGLAQHNLGNVYFLGTGVSQNDSAAVYWWTKAAEEGDAIPQWRLGTMYEEGRGVSQDLAAARRWYAEAADRGNERARTALERLTGN